MVRSLAAGGGGGGRPDVTNNKSPPTKFLEAGYPESSLLIAAIALAFFHYRLCF